MHTPFEKLINKLGSGKVEFLDSYQSGYSLDERSEDIALFKSPNRGDYFLCPNYVIAPTPLNKLYKFYLLLVL